MKWFKLLFVAGCAGLISFSISAHNKVVVVPMEEAPPPVVAVQPVAPANLSANDYFFVNYPNGVITVVDKTTGLEWQQEDDNINRWWNDAFDYCNDLNDSTAYANSPKGWRLPTVRELVSILNYGENDPAIVSSVFPGTDTSNHYQSSTNSAHSSSFTWTVDFSSGIHETDGRFANTRPVRCVRGQELVAGALQENGDGTVTDLATGLIWQQQDDGVTYNHAGAVSYCNNLSLGGKDDWYLPNIKELTSIIDYHNYKPSINASVFPGTKSEDYHSSSSLSVISTFKWMLNFEFGRADNFSSSTLAYVRCVSSEIPTF